MRFFILILSYSFILFSDEIHLNLNQFASLVSSQHRVNILVNDNIVSDKYSFYIEKDKQIILFSVFKRMLALKHLHLVYDRKKFYYIVKDKIKEKILPKKSIYLIKLKSFIIDDIKNILDEFGKDLKYTYIENSNSIMLVCTKEMYSNIKNVIQEIDYVQSQFQLKITIVETNLDDVKNRGLEISSYLQSSSSSKSSFKYFIDLLTFPQSATKNIFDNSSSGFTATLNFLNKIGITKIKSSPILTVQSGKNIYFSSVQNIPYLTSSSAVNGATQTDTSNVTYKDVGLKIDLLPKVIDDLCFIDLKFTIENVLSNANNTPSISKRELNSSFQLKHNQILVLSGINEESAIKSTYGIPVLMNAPFIGQMFRFDTDSHVKKTLSIVIQILESGG